MVSLEQADGCVIFGMVILCSTPLDHVYSEEQKKGWFQTDLVLELQNQFPPFRYFHHCQNIGNQLNTAFRTKYMYNLGDLSHGIPAFWWHAVEKCCGVCSENLTGRDRLRLTALTTNHHGGGANREFWKTLVYTSDAHVQWNTCDRWSSSYHDGIYFASEEFS